MRPVSLAFALALAAAAPALAAPARIPAAQSAAHVGQTVTVVGVLSGVHVTGGGSVLWNVGGAYPGNPITIFIPLRVSGIPDGHALIGKTLAITGTITRYHDKPEIVIKDKAQVAVAR
ncbi:MAG: hypothetical protein WDM91_07870 [Rhizomicrobium sp.]